MPEVSFCTLKFINKPVLIPLSFVGVIFNDLAKLEVKTRTRHIFTTEGTEGLRPTQRSSKYLVMG